MRIIRLDNENKVIGVRYGKTVGANEIQSDNGELGQIMLEDGTFNTPEPDPVIIEPSIEEQILFETQYQSLLLEMGMMF